MAEHDIEALRAGVSSASEYERRCSFDQVALDTARKIEAIFDDKFRPPGQRMASAQVAIIDLLMAQVSPISKTAFKRRPKRAGPAMRGILARLPVEGNFVLRDLMHSVKAENPDVTDKHVHNAIAHLTRRGIIKNIGYGRYEVSSPTPPHETAGTGRWRR